MRIADVNNDNVIYYGNLKYKNGSNLTGAGDGDDEQILLELNKIPSDIYVWYLC